MPLTVRFTNASGAMSCLLPDALGGGQRPDYDRAMDSPVTSAPLAVGHW